MQKLRNAARFRFRRIVLTGAGSGIGQALLELLAAYSVQIIAVDVDAEALEMVVGALRSARAEITALTADIAGSENIDDLFRQALRIMGGVDLFIANAGFAYYEQIAEPDWQRIEQIYRVNVFSPIYAAAKMKTINSNRPYKVVITASAMAHLALPGYAIYASTKAALHRFAEGYRFELDDPSTLTLVYPIATHTNFFNAAASRRIPMPWPTQSAQKVARTIIAGIEHDQISVYPSRLFALFLILERFIPFLRSLIQAREQWQFGRWIATGKK